MGMIRYCDHCGRSASEAGEIQLYTIGSKTDPVANTADLCQECYSKALSIFTTTKKWNKANARINKKTYHFWSDEDDAKYIEMWNGNRSVQEIAQSIGVTVQAARCRGVRLRKEGKLK